MLRSFVYILLTIQSISLIYFKQTHDHADRGSTSISSISIYS